MIFCFNYSNLKLNIISFVFSLIITILARNMFNSFNRVNFNAEIKRYYLSTNENISISNNIGIITNMKNNEEKNNIKNENLIKIENSEFNGEEINIEFWKIEIPKINLTADISNGTTPEILNKFVGHFEQTPVNYGNIVLAAHNRGYAVNYFGRIKELEIGDEIIYFFNDIKRVYKVSEKTIIQDTQWNKLENTDDNRLTLITCVENEPALRRCIQAKEV